jgi:hypothetical protein
LLEKTHVKRVEDALGWLQGPGLSCAD